MIYEGTHCDKCGTRTYSDVNKFCKKCEIAMTGLEMKYFVLKPGGVDEYAEASRNALIAYADIIRAVNEELANQLEAWCSREIWKASRARQEGQP